jgi:hypothetical protein
MQGKGLSVIRFNLKNLFVAASMLAVAVSAQRPFFLVPGVHPGYSLVNMKPSSAPTGQPNVGAMAWLPDGRLFVAGMSTNAAGGTNANRLGPTNGYIFSGLTTATTASTVTMTVAGADYQMPSGAVTVGDTIYVLDNDSGLTRLTPNGGSYTKKVVYSGLLGNLSGKTGSGYRTWTGGLAYKDGFFYASVGMGLIPGGTSEYTDANIYRGKGTILKISKAGAVVDTVAGGVRNPVTLQFGPEGQLFYADNQGSFMPASALFPVYQGSFFGHLKTPFDNQKRTAPSIIFPYGADLTGGSATNACVSRVATGFVQLKAGSRYAGQLLIGSNPQNGINRIFMEKVDGTFQGALFPFSQGFGVGPGSGSVAALPGVLPEFRANVHRIVYGPDGQLYVGGGNSPGGASSGSHGIDGTPSGALARMVANNDPVFEMKAVRSLDSARMEIEFTEPIVSAATSNFTVAQGVSVQQTTTNYGGGYQAPTTTLAVTAVTLNGDKTRATLTITGLRQRPVVTTAGSTQDLTWGSLIQIRVTGVAAVSGRTMWGDGTGGGVAWYTLNKFGPGVDAGIEPVSIAPSFRSVQGVNGLSIRRNAEGLRVTAPVSGGYSLRVSDLRGKTLATFSVTGGDFLVPASSLGEGVTVLEAKVADGRRWATAVPKL